MNVKREEKRKESVYLTKEEFNLQENYAKLVEEIQNEAEEAECNRLAGLCDEILDLIETLTFYHVEHI